MSSEPKPTQKNMTFSGGNVSKVQAAQADGDVHQAQQISESTSSGELGPADVVKMLGDLKELLNDSSLPTEQKQKAIRGVETAQDAVQEDEPDEGYIAKTLERITSIIKGTDTAVEAGTSLWDNAKPILKTLLPLFGLSLTLLA